MTIHYKYGGSTAGRTLNCAAWQQASADLPKPPASKAAELGTALHEVLLDECLNDIDLDPVDFVGKKINGIEITIDHIQDKIDPAIEAFEDLMDRYRIGEYWVEVSAKISNDIGGTADFIGVSDNGEIVVVADYKSGDGLLVSADNNSQGLFYAMVLEHSPQFKEVFAKAKKLVIAIVQPTSRREEVLDVWETTPQAVTTFKQLHDAAVIACESDNPEPTINEYCRWCPAEATCQAKLDLAAQADGMQDLEKLAGELSNALEVAERLEPWIKAVRKMAHERLENGLDVDGWKLVDKRAMRAWNNTEEVERRLKNANKIKFYEDACDSKVKSPAQIEKLCARKGVDFERFEDLVSSNSSGTTLVKAGDKRPAIEKKDRSKLLAEIFEERKLENGK